MTLRWTISFVLWIGIQNPAAFAAQTVSVNSLLAEMCDRESIARYPNPEYQCLQASSYNRASTHRDQPDRSASGWFADSDGLGFIRTEMARGKKEWVLMEHDGPGCITKIWTPFFYYDFNNRVGPNFRIYLDGSETPAIDESLIRFVRGEGTFGPPFAVKTARAGNSYMPIPFASKCKITMTEKPFYNIINYRAYAAGTKVQSYTQGVYAQERPMLEKISMILTNKATVVAPDQMKYTAVLSPGNSETFNLGDGPAALSQIAIYLPEAVKNPALLRSIVLTASFDRQETVWVPLGDFFCCADALHPYHTFQRTVSADGMMVCRWIMPYRSACEVKLINLGKTAAKLKLHAHTTPWKWDDTSMHFYARWRSDDIVPGTPFQDWNFVDIKGQGVYVGDNWTVLNIQGGWWGEGDEKIYVDNAWEKGFPTHFGTGTEDYYGWAGGVNPTRADEFSTPFLANVRVGGLNADTIGYNICSRTRSLDAIPFNKRLVFDMESSFGVDIRNPWNLLGYSAVTYWYAKPGAAHNRPALPEEAAKPIVYTDQLQRKSDSLKKRHSSQ